MQKLKKDLRIWQMLVHLGVTQLSVDHLYSSLRHCWKLLKMQNIFTVWVISISFLFQRSYLYRSKDAIHLARVCNRAYRDNRKERQMMTEREAVAVPAQTDRKSVWKRTHAHGNMASKAIHLNKLASCSGGFNVHATQMVKLLWSIADTLC